MVYNIVIIIASCIMLAPSFVPRPFKRRRKGLVHTARACAGVSIATASGRIAIVIVRGFCMTYSSMDDKQRVYDNIQLPHMFLGSPGACACNLYQALSPHPLELKCLGMRLDSTIHDYTSHDWLPGNLDVFEASLWTYLYMRSLCRQVTSLKKN